MELVLASGNSHKVLEIRTMLEPLGFQVLGMDAFPDIPEAPEDHDTFEENALQKARFVYERTGRACLADDSGIEFMALDLRPGVHSKRWTPEATDEANNAKALRELSGRQDRRARYRCVLAVVCDRGQGVVDGMCWGTIGQTARGTGGFGYDPLFWPDEAPGRTMAEISLEEKNRISHRAAALTRLPGLLDSLEIRPNIG